MLLVIWAGEPANFLTAPAPDFFFKRLWLQGAKNTRLLTIGFVWQNILFSANYSKVKLQKI